MKITLPWPKRELSPNARVHYFAKARAVKAYRTGCGWEAKAQGLRRIEADSLQVIITFHPPDRRRRDRDNMITSLKAGCDGVADVLGVDDSKWVPTYHVGEPVKRGCVVMEFPQIPDAKTDAEIRMIEMKGTIR